MQPQKLLLICISVIILSCSSKKQVTIIPLAMLNYTDTILDRGKILKNKADFYLVQGYVDNKKTMNYIDSFVEKKMDRTMKENSQYSIIFYKESKQTNPKNILANRKVIDRYSQNHDQIYIYAWTDGKFEAKYKVKNGKFVEPKSDIKVEDVPKQ